MMYDATEIHYAQPKRFYAVTAISTRTGGFEAEVDPVLLRPHFTPTRSLSISSPLAHAWAASSATDLSLKLTKAHLIMAELISFTV